MIRSLQRGRRRDGARAIDEELKPLVDALGVTINPIPVKAALNMLGHEVGGVRLPLVEATEDEIAEIRSGLERAGLTRRRGSSRSTPAHRRSAVSGRHEKRPHAWCDRPTVSISCS